MIFLTVGTQLPFERLVKSVDAWAQQHPEVEIIAQIGDTEFQPKHMRVTPSLSPSEYDQMLNTAEFVIGHVGIGTMVNCLTRGTPMILMPRLAKFGEHRNDHQVDTAEKFTRFESMKIAWDETLLLEYLDQSLNQTQSRRKTELSLSPSLSRAIQNFISDKDAVNAGS